MTLCALLSKLRLSANSIQIPSTLQGARLTAVGLEDSVDEGAGALDVRSMMAHLAVSNVQIHVAL